MVMIAVDREAARPAAELFRGLADPTRLAILLSLQGGERRVVDLVAELGTSQANVSSHLACLRGCGLVVDRPQGRQSFYRIARPELDGLLSAAEDLMVAVGHKVTLCPHCQTPVLPSSVVQSSGVEEPR